MLLRGRAEAVGAHAIVAGCVAVAVYGIAATIGWIANGTPPDALGEIALAVPVIFTVTAAIRGLAGLLSKRRPGPARAVLTDTGICVGALVMVAGVGSFYDSSGYALYGVLVMTPFVLGAAIVMSVTIELVRRRPWLIGSAIGVAGVVGMAALGTYAVSLS
ncbi:hypothetical protein [Cryobacterium sp. PH31-O1]|uniref:hypothetical protein n=1 Tax=Cryobacterium sp. PH31-O1 TaxID=3046306 RepID=UPI0024BAAC4E|nr:hypothetical protein [Cryobacterium sp. PH31-O1]MDJ0337142.1 hypothetical protein [Cryobacterium sp. PH31-O1]